MAATTTYLITGANRGIGLSLITLLLARPNTAVIATIRSPSTSINSLLTLAKAPGSVLIITHLSTAPDHSPKALLQTLTSTHAITSIDVLILNAGQSSFSPLLTTPSEEIVSTFEVNTLLPITLFQTLYPLLVADETRNPKVIYMSSYLSSIGRMEESPSLAYGMSKAAANYFVRKLHLEVGGVVSLAVHPGWLKTENGQTYADAVGAEEAPMEVDVAVGKIVEQIDNATKETTSGSFIRWDGETIPW